MTVVRATRIGKDFQKTFVGASSRRSLHRVEFNVESCSEKFKRIFDKCEKFDYIEYEAFAEAMAEKGVKPIDFFPYLEEHGAESALTKFGLGANA